MELLLFVASALLILPLGLALTVVLRNVLWLFSPIFFGFNHLIWFIYNPFRGLMKNKEASGSSILFTLATYTLTGPIYLIIAHIFLTPLRVINAIYFDILLYLAVMLQDLLAELLDPKRGRIRHMRGGKYLVFYVFGFPLRLILLFLRSAFTLVDSIFMFSMGVLLPTLTLYHGTDFNRAISQIGQQGQWLVGSGEYAGRGVYFGIEKRTAEHYARNCSVSGIIVARVTLSLVRNVSTLNRKSRSLVGYDGGKLSRNVSNFWATIEHWRVDANWWEYCLVHKGSIGDYVKTWRIRPVAFIGQDGNLKRLWQGQSHYCLGVGKFMMGTICTVLVVPYLLMVFGLFSLLASG